MQPTVQQTLNTLRCAVNAAMKNGQDVAVLDHALDVLEAAPTDAKAFNAAAIVVANHLEAKRGTKRLKFAVAAVQLRAWAHDHFLEHATAEDIDLNSAALIRAIGNAMMIEGAELFCATLQRAMQSTGMLVTPDTVFTMEQGRELASHLFEIAETTPMTKLHFLGAGFGINETLLTLILRRAFVEAKTPWPFDSTVLSDGGHLAKEQFHGYDTKLVPLGPRVKELTFRQAVTKGLVDKNTLAVFIRPTPYEEKSNEFVPAMRERGEHCAAIVVWGETAGRGKLDCDELEQIQASKASLEAKAFHIISELSREPMSDYCFGEECEEQIGMNLSFCGTPTLGTGLERRFHVFSTLPEVEIPPRSLQVVKTMAECYDSPSIAIASKPLKQRLEYLFAAFVGLRELEDPPEQLLSELKRALGHISE